MENAHDKLRAFALALAVHLLCIGAMLLGLWWTTASAPKVMPGPVIEATLVGPTAAPKPRAGKAPSRPRATKPPPAPRPEPPAPPSRAVPPPTQTQQDRVDQERIAALAAAKAEAEKKEQEEKHRQAQVLLEQQEKERRLEAERRKQLADIRRQREAAEKTLAREQARLAQLEDQHRAAQAETPDTAETEHEAAQATTGAGGRDDDLSARYAAAIQAAVTNNWNRPDSAQAGLRCVLRIIQIPGGDVISAHVTSPCNADQPTRNSIEQAVMKAAPLPYQGYEKVFQRSINFNFKYDG
jgi:colicin import membrane protein